MAEHKTKFRKPRGSRACQVCRMRKVRCDAELHIPCSNCITFDCECKFPELKRRKNLTSTKPANDEFTNRVNMELARANPPPKPPPTQPEYGVNLENGPGSHESSASPGGSGHGSGHGPGPGPGGPSELFNPYINLSRPPPSVFGNFPNPQEQVKALQDMSEHYVFNEPLINTSMVNITPTFNPLDKDGPTNGLKISQRKHLSDYVFFGPPSCYSYTSFGDLPYNIDNKAPPTTVGPNGPPQEFSQETVLQKQLEARDISCDLQVLSIKGAFYLPSRFICLQLIDSFFKYSYPHYPIIDKDSFMDHFNDPDPKKRPPLILINAVMLAGSKSCHHESIIDSSGHSYMARKAFFTRVKALLDSNCIFEYASESTPDLIDDGEIVFNYQTVLTQVYILLSIFWDGPEDVAKSPFFYVKSALTISQSLGFHKDTRESHITILLRAKYRQLLKNPEQFEKVINKQCFIWQKIWWTAVTKDKIISMAHGRPSGVDLSETNTPLLTLEDFAKYESRDWSIDNPDDRLIANFFINMVKLAEIAGEVSKDQYFIVNPKYLKQKPPARYQHFIKQHNLIMGLFFRDLPSDLKFSLNESESINIYSAILTSTYYIVLYHINRLKLTDKDTTKYWGISFQSAFLISQIAQVLTQMKAVNKQLLLTSHLFYSTSLALLILTFHTDSHNPTVREAASRQAEVCYQFLTTLKADWKGVVTILLQFYDNTFRQSKEEMISRAKHLVLKDNEKFKALLQNSHKSNTLKSFEINFLLNKDKEGDAEDVGSRYEFLITDEEYTNPALPLSNILTMDIPGPDDQFYREFSVSKLFPVKTKKPTLAQNGSLSALAASMRPYHGEMNPFETNASQGRTLGLGQNQPQPQTQPHEPHQDQHSPAQHQTHHQTPHSQAQSHVYAHGQVYPPYFGLIPPPPAYAGHGNPLAPVGSPGNPLTTVRSPGFTPTTTAPQSYYHPSNPTFPTSISFPLPENADRSHQGQGQGQADKSRSGSIPHHQTPGPYQQNGDQAFFPPHLPYGSPYIPTTPSVGHGPTPGGFDLTRPSEFMGPDSARATNGLTPDSEVRANLENALANDQYFLHVTNGFNWR